MHLYWEFVVSLLFELWPFNGLCHSLPQMHARGTMTRKYHQVSSCRRSNVPDEILTICGLKFTTRNRLAAHRRCGVVVVGGGILIAVMDDGGDLWGVYSINLSICLVWPSGSCSWLLFMFICSQFYSWVVVLLTEIKLLNMSRSLQFTVVLTEPGQIGKFILYFIIYLFIYSCKEQKEIHGLLYN